MTKEEPPKFAIFVRGVEPFSVQSYPRGIVTEVHAECLENLREMEGEADVFWVDFSQSDSVAATAYVAHGLKQKHKDALKAIYDAIDEGIDAEIFVGPVPLGIINGAAKLHSDIKQYLEGEKKWNTQKKH